jgi:signal transduction histidine kinase
LLGRTLRQAFATTTSLPQELILTETGRRIQLSLEFIHDDKSGQGLGALLTLHDLESVEAVESELELSRRMAAIGRLTSGVGHEVKNPINAIVVHVELLKSKLAAPARAAPASRHLEIIESEIHRLDRVVQMLVDFSRPVELQLRERDLRSVVGAVLALAVEELATQNVALIRMLPPNPLLVNIDEDLIKQAVLNVIKNGAQAMPQGGTLRVTLEESKKDESRRFAILRIADEGPGIPDDIREKIFDLYFTTKSGGSGIGLAMTYRILQLHYGSIEVQSNQGTGHGICPADSPLPQPTGDADSWSRSPPCQLLTGNRCLRSLRPRSAIKSKKALQNDVAPSTSRAAGPVPVDWVHLPHKKQVQPVQALAPSASSAPKPETIHPDLPDSATTIPPQPIESTQTTASPPSPSPITRTSRPSQLPPALSQPRRPLTPPQ